jgi:hypothetical protein
MNWKSLAIAFSASTILSVAVSHSRYAEAGYERMPGASCVLNVNDPTSNGRVWDGAFANIGPASSLTALTCPFVDTTAADHHNANFVVIGTINESNGTNYVAANACVQDYYDTFVACGVFTQSSYAQGFVALQPDLSQWTSNWGGDFAYFGVTLPGSRYPAQFVSEVTGIYVGTNP